MFKPSSPRSRTSYCTVRGRAFHEKNKNIRKGAAIVPVRVEVLLEYITTYIFAKSRPALTTITTIHLVILSAITCDPQEALEGQIQKVHVGERLKWAMGGAHRLAERVEKSRTRTKVILPAPQVFKSLVEGSLRQCFLTSGAVIQNSDLE